MRIGPDVLLHGPSVEVRFETPHRLIVGDSSKALDRCARFVEQKLDPELASTNDDDRWHRRSRGLELMTQVRVGGGDVANILAVYRDRSNASLEFGTLIVWRIGDCAGSTAR